MPSSSDIEVESPGTDVGCPKSYLQFLPTELILRIAECVSEDLVIPTAQDLLFLSLTCKRVFRITIRLLFKFNERMVNSPCRAGADWWRKGVSSCDIHRGFHRPALGWAISRSCIWVLKAVIYFTPKLCNSFHVWFAIICKKYNIAGALLRQKTVIDELKAEIKPDSPIFTAVASGHQRLVDEIIKIQGVDFEKICSQGMTVLDHACKMGHWDLAHGFLEQGANPHLRAVTSLQQAIYCSNAEASCTIVRGILTLRPEVRFLPDAARDAVKRDRLDVLEILLEKGAINQSFEGAPGHLGDLFQQAISYGAIAVYRKLLSMYPIRLLTERCILDALTLIPLQSDKGKAMQEAQWLIDHVRLIHNNDLSFLTYENLEPFLSNSIYYDNAMLVDYILGLSGRLRLGQIPFCTHWGVVSHSIEMLQMLRKHGFDINQIAKRETILQRCIAHIVFWSWHRDVAKYLASEVENINHYNEYKTTALHTWLRSLKVSGNWKEFEVLDFTAHLLDEGASLSISNARGNTPLHVAAVNTPHASVVQLLLDRGADTNAKNNAGETPLQYAMRLRGSTKASNGIQQREQKQKQKVLDLLAEWTLVLSIPPVRKLFDDMNSAT